MESAEIRDGGEREEAKKTNRKVVVLCQGQDAREGADRLALLALPNESLINRWRMKERMKTVSVALIVCLNVGVDPPDVLKVSPCARLECWVDPFVHQPQKALEHIGKNLQSQYERWQPRAKYKLQLDPTMDDVRKLCTSCRRNARNERVLVHYNGHGVPRPTANGEIWVFNRCYTQYIPLSVHDLQMWAGAPSIYVLDCSAAGMVVNAFCQFARQSAGDATSFAHAPTAAAASTTVSAEIQPLPPILRDSILLAACAADELLPQSASLPADVFSACLTTPIKMALHWFVLTNPISCEGIGVDAVDKVPGQASNRKTPLGELNWIFTAVTDTIAWNVLPRTLFQQLFRQDLLVASLLRNFLLAERVMRAHGCTPIAVPRLPSTHEHPIWDAWDLAVERVVRQLPQLLSSNPPEFQPCNFFSEQLTAFEVWLDGPPSQQKEPPQQLPIVLQVLLSQSHRVRALELLGRFLDKGPWAVDLALSVGIFPYVLKLLQTSAFELTAPLTFIWAKILALDRTCQGDLIKDGGHQYFIRTLASNTAEQEALTRASFALASVCKKNIKGQNACMEEGLIECLISQLKPSQTEQSEGLIAWLLMALSQQCDGNVSACMHAFRAGVPDVAAACILTCSVGPRARAAAANALGALLSLPNMPVSSQDAQQPNDCNHSAADENNAASSHQYDDDGRQFKDHEKSDSYSKETEERESLPYAQSADREQQFEQYPNEKQRAQDHSEHFHRQRHLDTTLEVHERAVASALLLAGADGSPLVREEIAIALGRMFGSARHVHLFAQTRRRSRRALHRPAGSTVSPSSSPTHASSPSDGGMEGPSAAASDSMREVPLHLVGVHALAPCGPYEPAFGTEQSGAKGQYASPDAARVGGDLYGYLIQCILSLSSDPAPRVAQTASAVMQSTRICGRHGMQFSVAPESRSSSGLEKALSRGFSSIAKSVSRGKELSLEEYHAHQSQQTPQHQHHTSQNSSSQRLHHAHSSSAMLQQVSSPTNGREHEQSSSGCFLHDSRSDDVNPGKESLLFEQLAEKFAQPMWKDERQSEHMNDDDTDDHYPSTSTPNWNANNRHRPYNYSSENAHEKEERMERLRDECRRTRGLAGEIAANFEVGNSPVALAMEATHSVIYVAEEGGMVSAWDYRRGRLLTTQSSVVGTVSDLHIANEPVDPTLIAGGKDGKVAAWRHPADPESSYIATAFDALQVSLRSPMAPLMSGEHKQSFVKYCSTSGSLFAAGQRAEQDGGLLNVWDLTQEQCIASAPVSGGTISCLSEPSNSLIVCGLSTGELVSMDMRESPREARRIKPHNARPIGACLNACGRSNHLATADASGEVMVFDIRMGDEPIVSTGACKQGGRSFSCHNEANMLALGSSERKLRILSLDGTLMARMKVPALGGLLPAKDAPVTTAVFHPVRPLLAAGALDCSVSVVR